jgi:hypothetical protein
MRETAPKIVKIKADNAFRLTGKVTQVATNEYQSQKIQYWIDAFKRYAETGTPHDMTETYSEVHWLSRPCVEPYEPDLLIKFGALLGYKVEMGMKLVCGPRLEPLFNASKIL